MKRLPAFALLLLAISALSAEGTICFEKDPADFSGRVWVSWDLPVGFEESELLIEIEGGPRVRLTRDTSELHPRATVLLPPLAGSARFVVRAGRKTSGNRYGREEQDVLYSPRFSLSSFATSNRVPVRATPSHPAPGLDMEWWSEDPETGEEGPAPPSITNGWTWQEGGREIPALPAAKDPGSGMDRGPCGAKRVLESDAATRPSWAFFQLCGPPFSGALTPLRN